MKLRSLQMRPHVTIKQLPQELMSAILVFLPRKDILSFSLACRYTERAAVRELYHTQGFRQSQQSVNQLIEFSKDAPRAQLVRTLVWDTDLWFLEANALDLELWLENVPVEHAVNAYRKYYGVKEVPPYQLAQIAKAGEEWFFHYQKNVMDEIIARNLLLWHFMFDSFLTNLPKLNKIYLLNGQFSFPLYNRIEYLCPTVPELRTYEYLPRGADRFNDSSPALGIGVRAFFDIIKGIYYWQVDRCRKGLGRNNNLKLRIKTLDYSAFTLGRSSIDQIEPCPEFSSLHIQITSERQGYMGRPDMNLSDQIESSVFNHSAYMANFLSNFPNLESLSLTFERTGHPCFTGAYINRVVPNTPEAAFSRLRKLKLAHMDGTEEVIVRLVKNHAKTLRSLQLHTICLRVGPSPTRTNKNCLVRLFDRLRDIIPTTRLNDIRLTGEWIDESHIRNHTIRRVWDFLSYGARIADYLFQGGTHPLDPCQLGPGTVTAVSHSAEHLGIEWTSTDHIREYFLYEWDEPSIEEDVTEATKFGGNECYMYPEAWLQ
jgi:hypothetical protein